ncbi:MAG TPA: cation:proton antiporter, partial [Alphaproteobacteria bacterium]|nr:cation:proton antiporter [Alphaproteobacteria bacterium]
MNLREVMVFLVAAGLIVPFLHRLKISPVLAFLGVGLVIGPYGIARFAGDLPWLSYIVIPDVDSTRALAELGVAFLLFTIGLELSLDRLWALRRSVFGLGGAQVLVTAAVIAGIASLFSNSGTAAILLGAAFALSSTAIVLQILTENRRLGTAVGQTSLSVLLFQDLAVLPILFLVGVFGAGLKGGVAAAL